MYAQDDTPEAGDFGDLYVQYHARLVRYCSRRLGRDDAEDAAHEVLLRALQAWSRFDASSDAWPWLATIASRVCADVRRRADRPVVHPGHHPTADVHDQAVARLRSTILEDALGRLPPRYRNPLVLKEYAGWSYRDIAELEGRSVASVRSTIMRSRRHLGARVESVARAQGQWPLPAAVPRLVDEARVRARRGHVVRTWLERAAQTAAAALDSSFLLGALTSPSAHAVVPHAAMTAAAAVVAAWGVIAPPATLPPAPPPKIEVQAAPSTGGAVVSATIESTSNRPVPNVRTVAHIDDHVPENPVIGLGPVEITAEYRSDRINFRVNNFFTFPVGGDTDEPALVTMPCLTAPGEAACDAVKPAIDKAAEDH